MACKYCNPETFPDKGISTETEVIKGKRGKWHKRIDGRYVKCTGKRTQTNIEMVLENAEVLQDQFDAVLFIARCKNGGYYLATDQQDPRVYIKLASTYIGVSVTPQAIKSPSSPLLCPKCGLGADDNRDGDCTVCADKSKKTNRTPLTKEQQEKQDKFLNESLIRNFAKVLVNAVGYDKAVREFTSIPGGPQVRGVLVAMRERGDL